MISQEYSMHSMYSVVFLDITFKFLTDMFMMAKIRVTDKDDNQIPENTEASTVCDSLFSSLKSMKLFINDKPIVSMPHFGSGGIT